MTDIKGTPLAVGDAVSWISMSGRRITGWVRKVGTCPYRKIPECVVDDGARDNPELLTNGFTDARVVAEGPYDRVQIVKVAA
jgi:hypothetical protein